MIGSFQFPVNRLALCMRLQIGLFCNAVLPRHFTTYRSLLGLGLMQLNYNIGKQSLSTQTTGQVVDEKSLTSVNLQSVIEHSGFFFLI